MTIFSNRILRLSTLALPAAAAAVVVLSTGNASPNRSDDARIPLAATEEKLPEEKLAAARFQDAPYGVDPVVTGPVSTAFEKRREAAGCDQAEWPHIPSVCYPD